LATERLIEKKSFDFALELIALYRQLQEEREYVLSRQLLRGGTSIVANVHEARDAQSCNDFLSRMSIAAKEAREPQYWLRLLQQSRLTAVDLSTALDHVEELICILSAIVKSTKAKLITVRLTSYLGTSTANLIPLTWIKQGDSLSRIRALSPMLLTPCNATL
jgi:four helix bundle protein